MTAFRLIGLFLLSLIFYGLTLSANPEEGEDDAIHIHLKVSSNQPGKIGHLVVPSALKDVESLVIKPKEQQLLLKRKGQGPVDLERAFLPSLPWHLSSGQFALFLRAHTFFLKQFNNGSYKVDIKKIEKRPVFLA